MLKKIKIFYEENDEVLNTIVIIITVLLAITILAIIDCNVYKNKYNELNDLYKESMNSYDKCKIDNKLLDTDMQMYREYYFENKK